MQIDKKGEWMVRQMEEQDIGDVAAIEQEIFSKPWSKKSFQDAVRSENTIYLVAEARAELTGYCGIWLSGETGDLCNMAVIPSCRRHGIGKELLLAGIRLSAERGAGELFLEVRESNESAIILYEKIGFQKIGIRKKYYHAPTEDAIMMRCEIGNADFE